MALVIFDNCEHLIESCAQLVHSLLNSCENLSILTTSRETLRVSGEIPYRVPSLELPRREVGSVSHILTPTESVRLFIERAVDFSPGFAKISADARLIAQICQRLDGIPLAIELAAARVNVLSVEQILERLEDRFNLLTSGLRSSLPRHQTLRATIEWSYDLLSEREQLLFRRLAVFVGGWTLEAAEKICGGEDIQCNDVLELLSGLVNKSLVLVKTGSIGESRYRRLETIRQYAQEKLWLADERESMCQRHLSYFVDLTECAELTLRTFDMMLWFDRLEAELDNIRVAIKYALERDIEAALRLTSALLWFWNNRGPWREGIDWLDRALSIEVAERGAGPLSPHRAMIRGKALNASAKLMFIEVEDRKVKAYVEEGLNIFQDLGPAGKQGFAYALLNLRELTTEIPQSRDILERSRALFREIGDTFGVAECLLQLADLARQNNDYEQATLLSEEQLTLRREIGDRDGIAWVLGALGDLAFWQNEYQRAITLHQESIAMFREIDNKWAIGHGVSILGDAFLGQRDYKRATQKYGEALAFAQDIGERFLTAWNFYNLGAIAWFQGEYTRANHLISDALALLRELGNDRLTGLTGNCMHTLGDIVLAQGDDRSAVHWYEAERTFGEKGQLDLSIMFAQGGSGKAAWIRGDYDVAKKKFEEGLRMSRKADCQPVVLLTLWGLGRVALSRRDYDLAHDFFAQASKIRLQESNNLIRWVWLKTYGAATVHPLEAFAILAAARNQTERVARLLGAAESVYLHARFAISARERDEYDQVMTASRRALGAEAFSAAYEEGKMMSLDAAVVYALDKQK
jgi:predicted ATPase